MNRSPIRTIIAGAGLCLMPALAAAQRVSVDYDRDADFSKYRSYTWRPGVPAPSPFVDKRIVDAVDKQLASRGWSRQDETPSAVVIYQAAVGAERELNAWGSGPRWNGFGRVSAETIYTGELVVDIYDAASRQLLWRGFASDTVSDKPEKNEKRLNEAVAKLFKQFPPARNGSGTK